MPTPLHLWSWNVNGLRACVRKGFHDWLDPQSNALIALQEVRALPSQLTEKTRAPKGWSVDIQTAEKKGYSGVGLYTSAPLDHLETWFLKSIEIG